MLLLCPVFHVGTGDWNPGTYARAASILLTEPCHQPNIHILVSQLDSDLGFCISLLHQLYSELSWSYLFGLQVFLAYGAGVGGT